MQRGSLLSEKPPPAVPKSVFDYLSAKSRERLASLTAPSDEKKDEPPAPEERKPAAPQPDVPLFVPPLDRPTANAALRGFQPYSAASTSPDPVKQTRYTLYLQYQASENASTTSSPFGPRVLPNGKLQTIDELNRELFEYAQAARVFKPVSGMLGNRFQSSQSGSLDVPKAEPGLYQPPPKLAADSASSLADKYGDATGGTVKPPEPALTPAQQAARAGNFGPLTRTTTVFRPVRLLCKRFGVRDPHEAQGDEGGSVGGKWGEATASGRDFGAGTAQPIGQAAIDEMMQSSGFRKFQAASKEVEEDAPEVAKGTFEAPAGPVAGDSATTVARNKPKQQPTIETVGYGDDEAQGQDIVSERRAPADIFAAIFADSDDDDSDGEDEELSTAAVPQAAPAVPRSSAEVDPYAPKPASAQGQKESVPDATATTLSLKDISTYRPSFVATTDKSSSKAEKPTKSKKRSSSKRKSGALSFDLEDGAEEDAAASFSARKKSKASDPKSSKERDRDARKRSCDEDRGSREANRSREQAPPEADDEWEEAAPSLHPDILRATKPDASENRPAGTEATHTAGPRSRPKAADLY